MKTRSRTGRESHGLMLVLLCSVALGGCSQTKSFLSKVGPSASFGSSDPVLGAPDATDYLRELEMISIDDPAAQAEIYADSRAAAQLTPNPTSKLRYALVLATPGHPQSDAAAAQSLLREVLAQTELLSVAEVALANIYLNSTEDQLLFAADAQRLRSTSTQAAQVQEAALQERLQRAEAENLRLRGQLAETEKKLDAITSIERSIREQDNEQ